MSTIFRSFLSLTCCRLTPNTLSFTPDFNNQFTFSPLHSSIGIVAHTTQPGELCLLQDTTITLDELDSDKVTWFFQSLANFTRANKDGGVIDIFCPLAASGL